MFVRSEQVLEFVIYFIIFMQEAAPELQCNDNVPEAFSEFTIVQPSLYHGKTKRAIYSTNSTEGEHHQKVTLELDLGGETLALDLLLNKDLLSHDHVLSYQKDGIAKQHKPTPKELNMCQYKGQVRGKPGSWAALSTCRGIRGLFHDGKTLRYIEPEGTTVSSLHFIYDHSKFGNGTESLRATYKNNIYNDNKNYIKDARYNHAPKEPYNGNPHSSYIELVAVVDNRLYRKRGGNLRLIYQETKDLMNVVNSMLAPLNIFVVLVGVKVWTERDEIYFSDSALKTLDAFLKYRFEKLLVEMPNDHAVLLTDQEFLCGVVGKAYVKKICTREHSGSVVSQHSDTLGIMAATIAHEIGHNLAMDHDSDDCECTGDVCIMAPSISKTVPLLWSNCSLKSLVVALQKGGNYCLRNKPHRLFHSPTCGNGFVESGEQCDCGVGVGLGSREACEACCNPDTCLLRSNASCATGSCCDLQTCQTKPVAKLCREAVGECDLPEFCTGESEFCPDDVHKMDTTPCDRNQAYCTRGECRSHDSQCRLLWGLSASNGDNLCYEENYKKKGSTGNCGYEFFKKTYSPCKKKDALCGRLQCRRYSDEIEFGSPIASSVHLIILKDRTCRCDTAIIDTGTDEDPGMVPDGAICGKDKICMDHQCVNVTNVRRRMDIKNPVCLSRCSGHGVCNSKGNCHCDAGFAPPSCESPGSGGSVDSGPHSDPDVLNNFMIAMYVIFLGILPLTISLLILICCLKNRKQNAKHENIINHLKLQNCTVADFKLFNYISKSSDKASGCNVQNNTKPKLRKKDIEVISGCEKTENFKPGTSIKVETFKIVNNNVKDSYNGNSDCVDATPANCGNMDFAKQKRPSDLNNSKVNITKSNNLVCLSQKNKLQPKNNIEALISKHKEAKISNNYKQKTSVESADISKESTGEESNVKHIRKIFDRTE